MKKKNQPYLVTRPYCSPNKIVIMALTKKDAIDQSQKEFGYCSNTSAKLRKKRGILLINQD